MMRCVKAKNLVDPSNLRQLIPSQVTSTLDESNGGMVYGRNRAALYYTIQRWHESFR